MPSCRFFRCLTECCSVHRGKSKAAGFLAFDLGNAALARFIVKWGKLLSLGMHFGLLENLPEIDHTEVDQEAGMVRILLHMRGTMWDANLVSLREKSLEWGNA